MEVGQGPNVGCSAKGKKISETYSFCVGIRCQERLVKTENPSVSNGELESV
jgi:hypothetical protein